MPVAFYMDVHIPSAITYQLRRRSVDVLTAIEDGYRDVADDVLLERALELSRVTFTFDIRFRAQAQEWQRTNRDFAGLLFGHQLGGTLGDYVRDLHLIAEASNIDEWKNVVEFLPFR